jgi:ligand-binding sensor domain-containing protein
MRKATVLVSAAALVIVAGGGCLAFLHMRSAWKDAEQQVQAEGKLGFALTPWHAQNAGFAALATPNQFVTGVTTADGRVYLAGPGGVVIYESLEPQLHAQAKMLATGMEIPAAPVVRLAAGRLRGASNEQVFAATRGEGVLIFIENAGGGVDVEQLLPAAEAERDVTAVLPLASGDLLIGTLHAGLLIYDGKTLRVFDPAMAKLEVTALAADDAGFWVGTRNEGARHWHAGQTDSFDASSGLPDAQVDDIAVTEDGVFVATPLGVTEFVGGKPQRVLAKGVFARAVAEERGKLLIATMDEGVVEVGLSAEARSGHADLRQSTGGIAGFIHPSGSAGLLGIGDAGIERYEGNGAWRTVAAAPAYALADRNVSALHFAADGKLWVGYFDHGLDVLDVASGRASHVEDDHIFCVNRIVADPGRETVDVATANGLVLFDARGGEPREKQVLLRKDGLISDQVTDVAFARGGMTLATPAGLTIFTARGAESLYVFQGLANNHVYALAAEPGSGRVMAGTLAGISVLEDGNVARNVTLKNSGLKRNWITAIVRVNDAHWLVGTYGGGVVEMNDAGQVQAMDGMPREFRSAVINPNAMLVTAQHVLAGSLTDGLLVYDRATQRWSQVTAGLPSKNVTAFAARDGEIYVGTENGVAHIAEARLP